jgi:hypothetical protein
MTELPIIPRYLITEYHYGYGPVKVSINHFLCRIKQWDYDSLVTDKDFEDAEALDKKQEKLYPKYNGYEDHNYIPTIDNADVWRQYLMEETPAMRRFLVSYAHDFVPDLLAEFRARGFQVNVSPVCYMGHKDTHMIIVAEERVNIADAVAWASRRKMISYSTSNLEEPVCLPAKTKCRGCHHPDHVEWHLLDSEELIMFGLEHGRAKLVEMYPHVSFEVLYAISEELSNRKDSANPFPKGKD